MESSVFRFLKMWHDDSTATCKGSELRARKSTCVGNPNVTARLDRLIDDGEISS